MRYDFEAETVRDLIQGLLRSRLRRDSFPSAVLSMVAHAMEQAHTDLLAAALAGDSERSHAAARHAPLLESAAHLLRQFADRQRERDDAHYADAWLTYFTVVIPFAETGATEWHPKERTGPFSTLTRGAFRTEAEAHGWAGTHIPDTEYSVRFVDNAKDEQP